MIIVVGAGAAGMVAAWRAASEGIPVLLLEKQKRVGTKILISGGGKCNVTHAGPIEDVRAAFRQNEGRFLRPSFYRFTNDDFVDLLTAKGMEVYTRPDGRIFPVPPADAQDVVDVLEAYLKDMRVMVRRETAVTRIVTEGGAVTGVEIGNGTFIPTKQLIVAVGGSSYPATGTTGDGWKWLSSLGHTIVPLRAALAPLYLDPTPSDEWAGVSHRDCILRARKVGENGAVGKEIKHWRGDLLWTHKGVSGPTALGVSREIAEALPAESIVAIDLLPDTKPEQLSETIVKMAQALPRATVQHLVERLVSRDALPERLVRPLIEDTGIDPTERCAYLKQKERNWLVQTLKGWTIGRVRHVPLERGEVVAGGVSLDEVDPKTMCSNLVKGLYLCGEVLDIAGPVGGYNLQAAWSTGYVAGETAAKDATALVPPG